MGTAYEVLLSLVGAEVCIVGILFCWFAFPVFSLLKMLIATGWLLYVDL